MTDLKNEILSNGQSPKSVTGDAGTVTNNSIPELIAGDLHLARRNAGNTKLGIRMFRTRMTSGPI